MSQAAHGFDPSVITRPHERLLTYYSIIAILTLPAFPITFIALYVRYRTLRCRFDDEGVWRRTEAANAAHTAAWKEVVAHLRERSNGHSTASQETVPSWNSFWCVESR